MSIYETVTSAGNQAAAVRDQFIETNGLDVEVYSVGSKSDLTPVSEVSTYTSRTKRVIKFLPSFKTSYELLPVGKPGIVSDFKKTQVFYGYVKTTENVNRGDIIKTEYSFAQDTVNVKYYEVQQVEVRSVLVPIGKKLIMTIYTGPLSTEEVQSNQVNFATVYPEPSRDFY